MENISFDNLSRQKLNFDSTSIITSDILRNADLIKICISLLIYQIFIQGLIPITI